jgi:LemA protein
MIPTNSSLPLWIFGGILLLALLYLISLYNYLISLKNRVYKNWANIDVLLKQRNDELHKLIETCKQYRDFERSTLEAIVLARNNAQTAQSQVNMAELGLAESAIRNGLSKLFALAENYPDLKTNQAFLQLQARISDLESAIADRRELYNESVNINNITIEQFPSNIIARLFYFSAADLLEFSVEEKKDVDIKQTFGPNR